MGGIDVITIPNLHCLAAFTPKTNEVFKESEDTTPVRINDRMEYMPWGASNDMPYQILDLIESDETLLTCQLFNAEMCYGAGLVYDTANATAQVRQEVDDFLLDNDLTTYFFGVSQDFKHFGFCVTVIILNKEGSKIVRHQRKEACYCRFAPADGAGHIPYILYANWRRVANDADIEKIEVLDIHSPFSDLRQRLDNHTKKTKVRHNHTHTNTGQHILSHPLLCLPFQGQVVLHQTTHRSRQGSEA